MSSNPERHIDVIHIRSSRTSNGCSTDAFEQTEAVVAVEATGWIESGSARPVQRGRRCNGAGSSSWPVLAVGRETCNDPIAIPQPLQLQRSSECEFGVSPANPLSAHGNRCFTSSEQEVRISITGQACRHPFRRQCPCLALLRGPRHPCWYSFLFRRGHKGVDRRRIIPYHRDDIVLVSREPILVRCHPQRHDNCWWRPVQNRIGLEERQGIRAGERGRNRWAARNHARVVAKHIREQQRYETSVWRRG